MDNKIFISYKRLNKEIVFPIVTQIEQEIGFKCWIDLDGIESGEQFDNIIAKAIQNAEILIFMMSKESLAPSEYESEETWTQMELRHARKYHKRIVPISIDDSRMSDSEWFDMKYGGLNAINWKEESLRTKFFKDLRTWLGIQDKAQIKEEIDGLLAEWKSMNEESKKIAQKKDITLQDINAKEKLLGDKSASSYIMANDESQGGNGMMQLQTDCMRAMLDEIRQMKEAPTLEKKEEDELYLRVCEIPADVMKYRRSPYPNVETQFSGEFNLSYRINADCQKQLFDIAVQSYIGQFIDTIDIKGLDLPLPREIKLNSYKEVKIDRYLLPIDFPFFVRRICALSVEKMDIKVNFRGGCSGCMKAQEMSLESTRQFLLSVMLGVSSEAIEKIVVTNSKNGGLIAQYEEKKGFSSTGASNTSPITNIFAQFLK